MAKLDKLEKSLKEKFTTESFVDSNSIVENFLNKAKKDSVKKSSKPSIKSSSPLKSSSLTLIKTSSLKSTSSKVSKASRISKKHREEIMNAIKLIKDEIKKANFEFEEAERLDKEENEIVKKSNNLVKKTEEEIKNLKARLDYAKSINNKLLYARLSKLLKAKMLELIKNQKKLSNKLKETEAAKRYEAERKIKEAKSKLAKALASKNARLIKLAQDRLDAARKKRKMELDILNRHKNLLNSMLRRSKKRFSKVVPRSKKSKKVSKSSRSKVSKKVKKASKYSSRYLTSEFSETDTTNNQMTEEIKKILDELKILMNKRKDIYLKKEARNESGLNKALKLGNQKNIVKVKKNLIREKKKYETERLADNILLDLLESNRRIMNDDYKRIKEYQNQLFTANEMGNDVAVDTMERKIHNEIEEYHKNRKIMIARLEDDLAQRTQEDNKRKDDADKELIKAIQKNNKRDIKYAQQDVEYETENKRRNKRLFVEILKLYGKYLRFRPLVAPKKIVMKVVKQVVEVDEAGVAFEGHRKVMKKIADLIVDREGLAGQMGELYLGRVGEARKAKNKVREEYALKQIEFESNRRAKELALDNTFYNIIKSTTDLGMKQLNEFIKLRNKLIKKAKNMNRADKKKVVKFLIEKSKEYSDNSELFIHRLINEKDIRLVEDARNLEILSKKYAAALEVGDKITVKDVEQDVKLIKRKALENKDLFNGAYKLYKKFHEKYYSDDGMFGFIYGIKATKQDLSDIRPPVKSIAKKLVKISNRLESISERREREHAMRIRELEAGLSRAIKMNIVREIKSIKEQIAEENRHYSKLQIFIDAQKRIVENNQKILVQNKKEIKFIEKQLEKAKRERNFKVIPNLKSKLQRALQIERDHIKINLKKIAIQERKIKTEQERALKDIENRLNQARESNNTNEIKKLNKLQKNVVASNKDDLRVLKAIKKTIQKASSKKNKVSKNSSYAGYKLSSVKSSSIKSVSTNNVMQKKKTSK